MAGVTQWVLEKGVDLDGLREFRCANLHKIRGHSTHITGMITKDDTARTLNIKPIRVTYGMTKLLRPQLMHAETWYLTYFDNIVASHRFNVLSTKKTKFIA